MTDMGQEMQLPEEGHGEGIDRLLRRSLAGPIPNLPRDFDQRVMRELDRRSQPLNRYSQVLLASYGLTSVVVSAIVMRGQGLEWGTTVGIILAPLALLALARFVWPTTRKAS